MLLSNISIFAQRYMVNGKEGKIRVVQYELVDGKWTDAKPPKDIYVENGYVFEAVPPVSKKTIIMEYEGKYYHVIWPQKELKLLDDMGKDSFMSWKNRARNSFIGDFYFSSTPGLIGLALTFLSLIVFIMGVFEKNTPYFLRVIFAGCITGITLLELGALLSVGSDAYWWCNPDDVGYLTAIPFTLLFGITITAQYYSIKMYKIIGRLKGKADTIFYIISGLGMVAATFAFIGVLLNFLFMACCAIFTIWFFGKASNTRNKTTDEKGKTIYKNDLGTKVD